MGQRKFNLITGLHWLPRYNRMNRRTPHIRVYHLNQQPWYTSYELPQYEVAYVWVNAKKLEYLAKNCGLATILKVLMGKQGFYNGGKSENFEIPFLPENFTNIGLEYTKRCKIATFGGVCFLRKVDFVYIFMRKSRF